MYKRASLILLLAVAAMLLLVSCQRSASQAPVSLETPTGISTATPTTGQIVPLSQIEIIQTQTAVYEQTNMVTPGISMPSPTTAVTPSSTTAIPPTGAASTPQPGVTPVVNVPTAIVGIPATYTLQKGEQPYCIARRFNVNQYDLLSLSGLNNASATNLPEGFVLHIPQNGNPFIGARTLVSHPGTYTVSSTNDTIYSIACYFGDIDPTQIITANNLVSPYTLHVNQTLTIP
jgi:LysM repeat protein